MAISVLTPLANNVPIVDEKGNPTPYFQRMLQQLLQEKDELQEAVDLTAGIDIIAGVGLDGGGPLDGSGDITLDLEDTAVTSGIYGDASNIPVIEIDDQGRIIDASEVAVSGGGGSAAWALAGTGQTATGIWDFAVDGAKANVDFVGLAGKTDILIIVEAVTKANSGLTQLVVSVDNGATFFTTLGNYTSMAAAGGETNETAAFFHGTNATLARTGIIRINGINLSGPRLIEQMNNSGAHRIFKTSASTLAINAVRISGSAAGNLTGGKIYCYAR